MIKASQLILVSACLLFAGAASAQPAQPAQPPRINALQLKTMPAPAARLQTVNPAATSQAVPSGVTLHPDEEALVQAEIKRQIKKRDDLNATLAKVGANYSKLTYTPVGSNSCIDPDTTWNVRSGETYTCSGQTTCRARMARWSKSRNVPCETGVVIDSCVITDECKTGSVCDTGAQKCIRQ
jgi:hypothetical protein